jgi:hypothetical protein
VLLVPFLSIIGEASQDGRLNLAKHLTGSIGDIEGLLTPEAMRALEESHPGYFAFLAFHPSADAAIMTYLGEGSFPFDSGSRALVLFTTEETGPAVWAYSAPALAAVTVADHSDLPVQAALRYLFGDHVPVLPGIAVFSGFSKDTDVVYFSLAGLTDAAAVRLAVRSLIGLADEAWNGNREEFADRLAVAALRSKLAFQRTGRRSMLEWLVQTFQWLSRHRGDIVTVVGLIRP